MRQPTLYIKTGEEIEINGGISNRFGQMGGYPSTWPHGMPFGYFRLKFLQSTAWNHRNWMSLEPRKQERINPNVAPKWECMLFNMEKHLYTTNGPFDERHDAVRRFITFLPEDVLIMTHICLLDTIVQVCKTMEIRVRHNHYKGILKSSYNGAKPHN